MSTERPYCFDDYNARLLSLKYKVHATPKPLSASAARHLANTLQAMLIDIHYAALREGKVESKIIASIDAQDIVENLEPYTADDPEILQTIEHVRKRIGRMQNKHRE